MRKAHGDFETRSALDLRTCGAHRQMEHPSTSPWMLSWRIEEDGRILASGRWHPGDHDPVALLDHIRSGGLFVAHNAAFERSVWNICIRQRICPHWPELGIEQMDCTVARCAAIAIPQTLEIAAQVLGARAQKDMAGNALMKRMMVPAHRIEVPGAGYQYEWHDTAADIARLGTYCDQDVVTEAEIDVLAPPLSAREREVWMLDQRINDRGIKLDIPTIEKMIIVRDKAKLRMDKRMAEITRGSVTKCSQNARLVDWIAAHGIPCKSIAKDKKEDIVTWAMAEGLPEVQEAIELRTEAAKTSTAKLDVMVSSACADHRSRGLLHYHGTNTGRWAGRLWQPHNLYRIDEERDGGDVDRTLDFVQHFPSDDALSLIDMVTGQPMVAMAKAMRSMIIADRGKRLIGADLSNIEGRVGAWLPGEEWKLRAFADYDAGRGPDLYKVAYSQAFGGDVGLVSGFQRQIGKVMELACVAGDQLVLTQERGLVRLDTLTLLDKLWDGAQWVRHKGLIDRGERDVFEYDGITATEDHVVWTLDGVSTLAEAAASGARLLRSEDRGRPIWVGESHQPNKIMEREVGRLPRASALHELRQNIVDVSSEFGSREVRGMQMVQQASSGAKMASETPDSSALKMHEPEGSRLEKLRRAGYRVSLQERTGGMLVGAKAPNAGQGARVGSSGQRRTLRAGEFAFCEQGAAMRQPAQIEDTRKTELGEPVLCCHDGTPATRGVFRRRDNGDGRAGSQRTPEKLARYRGKVRVYDVIDAGPRNRFTVSGVLVHNCGYQGSVGSFMSMGRNYGLKPASLVQPVMAAIDEATWNETENRYAAAPDKKGLSILPWTAIKIVVNSWRAAHPRLVQGWWDLQDAAIEAVANPGLLVSVFSGRVTYVAARGFLWCRLPSGRVLAYHNPRLRMRIDRWAELPDGSRVDLAEDADVGPWVAAGAKIHERKRSVVLYDGYDGEHKRWGTFSLYGGMQFNHIVQGTARDVLVGSMLRLEARGYWIILTVHDETLCENEIGFGSVREVEELMTQGEPWLHGCPLAAKGWEGARYG